MSDVDVSLPNCIVLQGRWKNGNYLIRKAKNLLNAIFSSTMKHISTIAVMFSLSCSPTRLPVTPLHVLILSFCQNRVKFYKLLSPFGCILKIPTNHLLLIKAATSSARLQVIQTGGCGKYAYLSSQWPFQEKIMMLLLFKALSAQEQVLNNRFMTANCRRSKHFSPWLD